MEAADLDNGVLEDEESALPSNDSESVDVPGREFSATLADGSSLFIEQIGNGTLTPLHVEGVEPVTAEGEEEHVPILLHLTADATSQLAADSDLPKAGEELPTMYTIHLTESDEKQEDPAKLEDFMDVVTTYECKFCRFSCPWKSGLMSHIRSCHLDASSKNPNACGSADRQLVASSDISDNGEESCKNLGVVDLQLEGRGEEILPRYSLITSDLKPQERHIFLCGQCSRGFSTLEQCKKHIVKDHGTKTRGGKRRKANVGRILSEEELEALLGGEKEDKPADKVDADLFLERSKKRKNNRRDCMVDRLYRCSEKGCGYRFKTEANLQYHVRCHATEDRAFACPECKERFEYWRQLAVHLWKKHSVDLDLFSCDVCPYKSYSLFKLDNHQRIHREAKEFACGTCGKGFKQISQLRNHQVVHLDRSSLGERRWYSQQECETCGRLFSDSKCLRKHQQAVHKRLKPYVCSFCGHSSARKAMLQLHVRQHTGEKPFGCDHCEYRTGDHNSLRRHRMRHTGAKPYKCPHCPYACIQAISYKTHLKSKHPGLEGLYACQLCTFRSVNKENYVNHMSDHKRGVIPACDDPDSDLLQQEAAVPDATLQQLEGILPGNVLAAQLIYNCLNALSSRHSSDLPAGVTTTSNGEGTQTITIQVPASLRESEQFFLTVQQQDHSVTVAPDTQHGSRLDGNDSVIPGDSPPDDLLSQESSMSI